MATRVTHRMSQVRLLKKFVRNVHDRTKIDKVGLDLITNDGL